MAIRKNVYQIIEADEKFSILFEILNKTGIGKAIRHEENPFTFFAPTDGAFYQIIQKAPDTPLPDIGKIPVASILSRHIIPGVLLYTDDLRSRQSITNLEGKTLMIKQDDHRVFIGAAQILTPATSALNGVVFAVDKVLLDEI